MKKIITVLTAIALLSTSVAPSQAFDARDGALVFGGVIGGIIIGNAINNANNNGSVQIYQDEPIRVCKVKRVLVWDDYYEEYYYAKKRVCRWVYPND